MKKPMTDAEVQRMAIASQFMLASEIKNTKAAMFRFPLLGQPKLNGLRARYVRAAKAFFSRDGVRYANATTAHIKVPDNLPYDLDGEFYVHGWSLQRINSAITPNRLTPTADTPLVQFHAFDAFAPVAAVQRARFVETLDESDNFRIVRTTDLFGNAQADKHYLDCVSDLYEGAIYRWPSSIYVPGRSFFMLKRKAWTDGEYEIVGFEEGENRLTGTLGAFVCARPNGGTFNVGGGDLTDELRDELWADRVNCVGRMLKIKHLGLSDTGSPISPQYITIL